MNDIISNNLLVIVIQLQSCVRLFLTWWTAACRASVSFTVSWSLFKFMSIESGMLSNHPSSGIPFFSHLQSFPASGSFPMSQPFTSGGQSIEAKPSALPMNIQGWFPLGLTGLRSSLSEGRAPELKSINSLAFSLLYGPTLTSVSDYWKNYSIDCTDLHQQNDVSAF